MTVHAMKGDRERCIAAGLDDYMAKPINRPELMDCVRRNRPAGSQVPTSRVSINSLGIQANDLLGRLGGDATSRSS